MIEDLEDNYENYLDDALGYAWDAWDTLSLGEINQHDTMLHADAETRSKTDLGLASDLIRWAYCRAALRDEDTESFLASARLILAGDCAEPAIEYLEIFGHTILVLADAQLFDEARLFLTQAREKYAVGDDLPSGPIAELDRVEANVAFREGAGVEAFDTAQAKHPDDAEFAFDLAEDVLFLGEKDAARRLAESSERIANAQNLTAILVDLQSLNRRITEG